MKKTRLLIIDDNRELVLIIKDYFSSNKEIEVTLSAEDGNEGIKVIDNDRDKYDLILLDLILPKKDGITILEHMNKKGINKPVIVLTSYNADNAIQRASELGARYYLLKPFDLSYLETKINNIMKNTKYNNISIDLLNSNLQILITNTLHELGVPSHINGYNYIRDAINIVYAKNETHYITKDLYTEIANKYDSTPPRIERSIRHAIDISWNRGNWELMEKIFGNSIDIEKAKPTNSEFIITIADMLKLEIKQGFLY